MSFNIKVKLELTVKHKALEDELGEDYTFPEAVAFLTEEIKDVNKEVFDPDVSVDLFEFSEVPLKQLTEG